MKAATHVAHQDAPVDRGPTLLLRRARTRTADEEAGPPEFSGVIDWSRAADPDALMDHAATGDRVPLPWRARLEDAYGPLPEMDVRTGPKARAALDALGAEAATRGDLVVLKEAAPPLRTVAHEVAHVVQSPLPGGSGLVGAYAPAERAADAAADAAVAGQTARPLGAVGAGAVALLRPRREDLLYVAPAALLAGLVGPGGAAEAEAEVGAPLDEATSEGAPIPGEASEAVSEGTASTNAAEAPGVVAEPDDAAAAAEAEGDVGVGAAADAGTAVAEADTVAEAGTAEADTDVGTAADTPASGVSFLDATPSERAFAWSGLGETISDAVTAEQDSFAGTLPVLDGAVAGVAEVAPLDTSGLATPAVPYSAPALATVELPELDAPPVPGDAPTIAVPVDDAATEQEKAAALGEALATAPDLGAGAVVGAAPTFHAPDGADPAAVGAQGEAASTHLADAQTEAVAVIAEGPGPEDLLPVAVTAVANPVTPAPVAAPLTTEDVPGMAFLREHPPEPAVRDTFDAALAGPHAAALGPGQAALDQANAERDAARSTALTTADAGHAAAVADAEAARDDALVEQQTALGSAQAETIEAQQTAIATAQAELDAEQTTQSQAIEARGADDQAAIDGHYADAQTTVDSEVVKQEQAVSNAQADQAKAAADESWWDKAVSAIKSAIDAWAGFVKGAWDAVHSVLSAAIEGARNLANQVIAAGVKFAQEAVAAYATFATGLIADLLGDTFPGLAAALTSVVNGVAALYTAAIGFVGETLTAAVNGVASGLQAGLDAAHAVALAAIDGVVGLWKAALDGDWSAVARVLLEAALTLAGIDPAEFFALVGDAQETWALIVADPGHFVENVLSAGWLGITNFADNILKHLQAGFIGWLTGAMPSSIEIPETWTLGAVLDMVMGILGLTYDHILDLARGVFGDTAVAVFDWVVGKVDALITGGWQGLWDAIAADLSGLVESVIQEISEWAIGAIVQAAVPKLLAFIDPTFIAAIVSAIQMLWGAYTFLRDQFQRLYGVVQSVVGAISDLAHGVIDPAAKKVETVLGDGIPLVLDLLAKLIGVDVAGGVRGALDKARKWIDDGITSMLIRFKGMFPGGAGGVPEEAGPEGEADFASLTRKREVTLPDGEVHHVYVTGAPGKFEVVMASANERPLTEHEAVLSNPVAATEAATVEKAEDVLNLDAAKAEPTPAKTTEIESEGEALGAAMDRVVVALERGGAGLEGVPAAAAAAVVDVQKAIDLWVQGRSKPGELVAAERKIEELFLAPEADWRKLLPPGVGLALTIKDQAEGGPSAIDSHWDLVYSVGAADVKHSVRLVVFRYPKPEVAPHTVPEPLPLPYTRESHHVPSKALAGGMSTYAFQPLRQVLVDLGLETGPVDARIALAAKKNDAGDGLNAILLHPASHRNDPTSIHSAAVDTLNAIQAELLNRRDQANVGTLSLAAEAAEREVDGAEVDSALEGVLLAVLRTTRDQFSKNPGGTVWLRFLQELDKNLGAHLEQTTWSGLLVRIRQLPKVVDGEVMEVHEMALTQMSGKLGDVLPAALHTAYENQVMLVVSALGYGRDGTPAEQASALKRLASVIGWSELTKPLVLEA